MIASMEKQQFTFSQKSTSYYFGADLSYLDELVDPSKTLLITDENIFRAHKEKLKRWNGIVLPAGEEHKIQSTVNLVIEQLIELKADRKSFIVGIGGGVITDLTGYAASVYMRGIKFGFIPVSILSMVDAAIGGENGIDVGNYKNLVGTINQPEFLLYDYSLLSSLPEKEWINGFAEVIKHACIKDADLFNKLEQNDIHSYKNNSELLGELIKRNAVIKSKVVVEDEFEKGERKLLNFGHTWGHAIETRYQLPHGHAVSIGMMMACKLSEQLTGFTGTERVKSLIEQYDLPVALDVNKQEALEVLKMDKKKDTASMNYVLLEDIGKAVVMNIPMEKLEQLILSV